MSQPRQWIIWGALLAALSVVLGAFAAHGLEAHLAELYGTSTKKIAGFEVPASYKYAQDFVTASRYQMYHSLGLILLGLVAANDVRRSHRVAAWCFVGGIVLFSGSLYVLVLTGKTWLGAIAPIGGTLMIIAWVAFACGTLGRKSGY